MTTLVVEKAVIERAIRSINRACDLVELGSVEDAIETLNYVLDEIEPLANEKGHVGKDVAPNASPHPTGRTADDEDCSARSG